MSEFLQYGFMLRALIAGLLVAITLPFLGSFLVAKRYSLIADSLAHVALAGLTLGMILNFQPLYAALPVTIFGALTLEYLRQSKRISGETSLAIIMSSGLAVAVVLSSLSGGGRSDFYNFLFGSITTTTKQDVIFLSLATFGVLTVLIANYRSLMHIAFDEDSAKVSGLKVSLQNYILASLAATMVVLSIRIVGGLLIGALLVIPVVTAGRFANSFKQTVLWGSFFSVCSVLFGLVSAYYTGIAAGGSIVLASLVLFIVSVLWSES